MTSEWTQRTALATFTLSPRRLQVRGAKYVAVIAISFVLFAAGVVLTLAGMAAGGAIHSGQSLTAITIWVIGPSVLGIARILRRAVK